MVGETPLRQAAGKVLVVAGTHGNERNAPWLLQQGPASGTGCNAAAALASSGLALAPLIGNPSALAANLRYLDRDLNRSFAASLLADPARPEREIALARSLLATHGPEGEDPCLVVFDLHSTTAAMGSCLVVYGRRPPDLALAAGLQAVLGLPVYLHEADANQTGFLAECWPCGLAIEVGPVPQGLLSAVVIEQTRLALEAGLAVLAGARRGRFERATGLVVHRHLGSLDLPRHGDGTPAAVVHPLRQGRDWQPIEPGDPLFLGADGRTIVYEPAAVPTALPHGEDLRAWPVFINEAAYGEKGIAMSLTRREVWPLQTAWLEALQGVAQGLQPAAFSA